MNKFHLLSLLLLVLLLGPLDSVQGTNNTCKVYKFTTSSSSSSSTGLALLSSPTLTPSSSSSSSSLDQITFFHNGTSKMSDVYSFGQVDYGAESGYFAYTNTSNVEGIWTQVNGVSLGTAIDTAFNNAPNGTIPIGLTSAVPLGGLGTGNYEIRADGKMYVSTIRNQDMAGEPWQGTVRDFFMAVSINQTSYAIRIDGSVPGLSPVPKLVYQGDRKSVV